ncbi:MAG: hypothetical protein ACHWZW_14125 [Spirulina sp.]
MTEQWRSATDSAQLLRWWHQHQARWLVGEADAVRNGILQDLFAVRRQLEMMAGDDAQALATIEHLYSALENLGDRLSSPYLFESLPLALQHALKQWPADLALEVKLPSQWPKEPMERVTLVLSVVDHIQQTLAALSTQPQTGTVELAETQGHRQLTIAIHLKPLSQAIEGEQSLDWAYHLSTFEAITGGQAHCTHTGSSVTWQLTW